MVALKSELIGFCRETLATNQEGKRAAYTIQASRHALCLFNVCLCV